MSISSALNNAVTGLGAVSRGLEVVSSNIANANTDGYARRELGLSGHLYTGGVRVDGVNRMINANILSEFRITNAGNGGAEMLAEYFTTIEKTIGVPGDEGSISSRIASFESALIHATGRPDSDIRLGDVINSARDLVALINQIGSTSQEARQKAENAIDRDVQRLNSGLQEVSKLNRKITNGLANGQDISGLADTRQRIITELSDIIPLREVQRDRGQVSLFTAHGIALLDGMDPAQIEFPAQKQITPEMSATNGDLVFLTIDGRPLTQGQMELYAGGRLSASFEIRDRLAPDIQARADAFAQNLALRFGSGGPDDTVPAGAAGLFTDQGAAISDASTVGLAQRLAINSAADPDKGGTATALRDGLYATQLRDPGDGGLLDAMISALQAMNDSPDIITGGAQRDLAGIGADLSSAASSARLQGEEALTRSNALHNALQSALLAEGVDTDQELERLLILEQAYAANARVIMAADMMLDTILGI